MFSFLNQSVRTCLSLLAIQNFRKALLPLLFVLVGCDADGLIGSSEESARNEIPLQVPQKIRQARAVNLNQVTVSVTVRGNDIPVSGSGGNWFISLSRASYPGVSSLSVRYSQEIGGQLVPLAEFNGTITMSDTATSIDPVGSMRENFDNDGDTFSNLTELSATPPSDPLDISSLPGLIDGFVYSYPETFSQTFAGEIDFQNGSTDYQRGSSIYNADNGITCWTGVELGSSALSLDTVNGQIISALTSDESDSIISVEDIEVAGFGGQEVVINAGEVEIEIASHYFIPADRFFLQSDSAVVFYFSCSSGSENYSQNESVMRGILDSVRFTTTSD